MHPEILRELSAQRGRDLRQRADQAQLADQGVFAIMRVDQNFRGLKCKRRVQQRWHQSSRYDVPRTHDADLHR